MTDQPKLDQPIQNAAARLAARAPDGIWPGTMQDVLANVPGMTYRRLDYWTRTGLLPVATDATPGSGHLRIWNPDDYPAMRRLVMLAGTKMDLQLARRLAWRETSEVAPGMWLEFDLRWVL